MAGKKHGYCDCGNVATVRKNNYPVCARCDKIELRGLQSDMRHTVSRDQASTDTYRLAFNIPIPPQ